MKGRTRAARRYAQALFALAEDEGAGDPVAADLEAIGAREREVPAFGRFLADERLPREVRARTLASFFADRVHPLTYRFLRFLDARGRMRLLAETAERFAELRDRRHGIVRGRLVSAFALDPASAGAVQQWGQARVTGRLELVTEADPRLLGGFRLFIGGFVYDGSVATQLRRAGEALGSGAPGGIHHVV